MNRSITSSLIILLCLVRLLSAAELAVHLSRPVNSAGWPEFVSYTGTEPLAASLGSVAPGSAGSLIRREADGRLLIDFGREGRAWIQPEVTDFAEREQALLNGSEGKLVGNALRLIGPRLLTYDGETLVAYPIEELMEQETFLLFYGQPDADYIAQIADWSAEHEGLLASRACQPVFMPLKKSTDAYIASLFKKQGESSVPFMRSHLSPLYVEVLQHLPESRYTAVLIDANGQLLSRSEASELDLFKLETILKFLEERPKITPIQTLTDSVDESVRATEDQLPPSST